MLGQSFVVVSISLAVGLVALFGPAGISANGDESQEAPFDPEDATDHRHWAKIEKNVDIFDTRGYRKELFYIYEFRLMAWLRHLRSDLEDTRRNYKMGILKNLTVLEKFKKIVDEKRCDDDSVKFRNIMADHFINRLYNGYDHREPYYNIRDFVEEWSYKHWKICLPLHVEEHSRRAVIWDDDAEHTKIDDRLETFFGGLFSHRLAQSEKDADRREEHESLNLREYSAMSIAEPLDIGLDGWAAEFAYDTVNNLASIESDSDSLLEGGKLRRVHGRVTASLKQAKKLFTKFIRDSCEEYVKFWGPDLFSATKSDQKRMKKSILRYHSERNPLFYQTWSFYNACESLTGESKQFKQLLYQIELAFEKRSKPKAATSKTTN